MISHLAKEGMSQASLERGGLERETEAVSKVVASVGSDPDTQMEISYSQPSVIGSGSFGVVFSAHLRELAQTVAIKKVLQDKRYKNRELEMMVKISHPNVVKLLFFFYSSNSGGSKGKKEDVYLNLVLEYLPETLYRMSRKLGKEKKLVPAFMTKVYVYQMFRGLAYCHSMGICHRDVKPQNLLVNPDTGVLKLCDFGSAKLLAADQSNVAYICSRYYRAPELIFGATHYSTDIDTWSAGCVLAELLLGQPLFPGDSGVDQLVEIIKVLGTPSKEQILLMNPNYSDFRFPVVPAMRLERVFRPQTSKEAVRLLRDLLVFAPGQRLKALQTCAQTFFDELRAPGARLPSGKALPPLFNFSDKELAAVPVAVADRLKPTAEPASALN